MAKIRITGFRLCLGAKYSPIPQVRILFEAGRDIQMQQLYHYEWRHENQTVSGHDKDKKALLANEISLGVEVGI